MGGFLAGAAQAFRWDVFLLCISTTIFLQILSNLANDYGDSVHGADSAERKGPSRAVQAGLITAAQMRRALWVFILLCLASGIGLLWVAFGSNWQGIFFFLGLGVLSILAAMAYTMGRKPYGYSGLGDISVLLFFGLVGVLGSYYLFTQNVTWADLLPAFTCGFFSIGVLNINNIRDIESDRKAGKYSVPVRIGRKNAIIYHWVLLTCGLLCLVLYTVLHFHSYWQLLFLLAVPMLYKNAISVTQKQAHELDPYLKHMSLTTLAFVLLFGIGLIL